MSFVGPLELFLATNKYADAALSSSEDTRHNDQEKSDRDNDVRRIHIDNWQSGALTSEQTEIYIKGRAAVEESIMKLRLR